MIKSTNAEWMSYVRELNQAPNLARYDAIVFVNGAEAPSTVPSTPGGPQTHKCFDLDYLAQFGANAPVKIYEGSLDTGNESIPLRKHFADWCKNRDMVSIVLPDVPQRQAADLLLALREISQPQVSIAIDVPREGLEAARRIVDFYGVAIPKALEAVAPAPAAERAGPIPA